MLAKLNIKPSFLFVRNMVTKSQQRKRKERKKLLAAVLMTLKKILFLMKIQTMMIKSAREKKAVGKVNRALGVLIRA